MTNGNSKPYLNRTCPAELAAIVVLGTVHVLVELNFSESVAFVYNAIVSVGFLFYLVWRATNTPGVLRAWGMRQDNLFAALKVQTPFAVVAVIGLFGYAIWRDSLLLPWGFWLTIGLYPIWGITQQFALQNLVARNLTGFLRSEILIAASASALFAASHYPRIPLILLTVVSGFFFTLAYRTKPNLWAVGIVHGILGSLAVYFILQEDPGAALWALVSGQ